MPLFCKGWLDHVDYHHAGWLKDSCLLLSNLVDHAVAQAPSRPLYDRSINGIGVGYPAHKDRGNAIRAVKQHFCIIRHVFILSIFLSRAQKAQCSAVVVQSAS